MQYPHFRILVVDLDAHQGNGVTQIARNQKNIFIFDMYNGDTWPGDFVEKERIDFDYPLKAYMKDEEYLSLLAKELPKAIDSVKPDLIIYNAGTDIYFKDTIGALGITAQGITKRDEIVFENALNRNIPITMVFSGGYHTDSALIISESLKNLFNKLFRPFNNVGSVPK